MAESRFDKDVKDELEKLRLSPSLPVWERIEGELREKKRRRVLIWFTLLAFGIIAGYGGYKYFSESSQYKDLAEAKKQERGTNQSTSITKEKPDAITSNTTDQPTANPLAGDNLVSNQKTSEEKLPDTKNATKEATSSTSSREDRLSTLKNNKSTIINRSKNRREKSVNQYQSEEAFVRGAYKKTKKPEQNIDSDKIVSENLNKETIQEKNNQPKLAQLEQDKTLPSANIDSNLSSSDVVTKKSGDTIAIAATAVATDSVAIIAASKPAKNKRAKKSAIIFRGEVGGGLSDVIVVGNHAPLATVGYMSAPQLVAPSASNSFSYGNYSGPSSISPGKSFYIGAAAVKSLNKRASVSAGLRYAYASTTIKAGTASYDAIGFYADSMARIVQTVYAATNEKALSNSYHFVELPVSFEYVLNKKSKIPVSWSIGLIPGYIVSSNNFIYSSSLGGVYYKNQEALNKFQLTASTGFQVSFSKKRSWSIGPEVFVATGKLLNADQVQKQRMISGKLSGRFNLFSNKQ